MANLKKTNLADVREKWNLCMNCAACYYHGPIIPHNWLALPPEEWAAPLEKCPSFEFFLFKAYTPVGRLNLATVAFSNDRFPITDDLLEILYTCDTCGMCNEICPYSAIEFDVEKRRSRVNSALCKACGGCVATCPSSAIKARHFTDQQIVAQIEGVLS